MMARRAQPILKQLLLNSRAHPSGPASSRSVTMPRPGDGAPRSVTLIPGDGIEPLVTSAVEQVMEAMHAPVCFERYDVHGDMKNMPSELIDSIRRNKVCLKGGLKTPMGGGVHSLNVLLRKELDLYASLVHCFNLQGLPTRHQNVDIVVIRENTEGEYSGLEHEVVPGVVESLKVITKFCSERIAQYAFEYAYLNNQKKVTAVHKANIMKLADGLFLESCREVASKYPGIKYNEIIVDNCCMQLVSKPEQFDVMTGWMQQIPDLSAPAYASSSPRKGKPAMNISNNLGNRKCLPLASKAMWKKSWSMVRARTIHLRLNSSLESGSRSDEARNLVQQFTAYCYQRDLPRAMKTLDVMQNNNVFADSIIYSELIKCCVCHRAIAHGKRLHQHIFSDGYAPKTFLLNSLLNMYVKFELLNEAHTLFDQMPERNVVSWSTIIWAYATQPDNCKEKALELLVLMLRDGVRPNMFTYSSILKACDSLFGLRPIHGSLFKVGLESDVFVRSSLIDVYSKLGELTSGLSVFNEMVTGDSVVWNSIITGFAQNNDGDHALHLYKAMRSAGFNADQSTLTSVLRACTSLALLELGRQVHVHVTKYGRDLALNNALLDMYCKCGSFDDADYIFSRMVDKDVISWSTMILGFAQNGFSRKALDLFEAMNLSGIKPNNITMLGVLFACSHAGLVEDGLSYFHSMRKLFGVDPGREHYGCMVDLLGRAGRLDEAVKLIHEMGCEPDAVTWRALLGACRVHRNMDLAAYAAEQITKLDPEDPGNYILLSNIYANSQRWDDVWSVRNEMKQRGINKEPGCSWIEVDKHIHAFIVGDSSHPQISSIKRELKEIIRRLQEVGYVPDTNYVLQDIEGEQMEESLLYHSEKLAIVFGLMKTSSWKTIRIRKNLRICGDCHVFAKLLTSMTTHTIVIRDPIRYHHFHDGLCSCGDYW